MARLESRALAGYFPTPEHLLAPIASLVEVKSRVHACDPCAGDGTAIIKLMELWKADLSLFTCEMEGRRHALLKAKLAEEWRARDHVLHGDAFRISFKARDQYGASLLFLNPPYDTDKDFGRLEEKFLERFTRVMAEEGVLLFVVPHYALSASANTLAKHYKNLHCFKFPEADFGFKQVVLVAERQFSGGLEVPDKAIVSQVEAWAKDATSIPELVENLAPVTTVPYVGHSNGPTEWVMRPVDTKTLRAKIRPWFQSQRRGVLTPVPNVIPALPVQEMLLRTYPVATPPRPAHIAAGIASGLFNGARITPDDPASGLPDLLLKGVFDREYVTIDQKENSEGKVIGEFRTQQPKLVTTILNLQTHQYHILKTGTEATDSRSVEEMTVADLLNHYSQSLMAAMGRQCPVLYDPKRDSDAIPLVASPRKLFKAQEEASKALVKLLGGPGSISAGKRSKKAAILLGEIGSGKSTVALMAARSCGSTRPLVLCPPHLLDSWTNEIKAVLPDAEVRILSDLADVEAVNSAGPDKVIISLLSRESAKLTHGWEGVGHTCPKCGGPLLHTPEEHVKGRLRCHNFSYVRGNKVAEWCKSFALRLAPYTSPSFTQLTGERIPKRFWDLCQAKYKERQAKDPTLDIASLNFADQFGGLMQAPTAWERLLLDDPMDYQVRNARLSWVDDILDYLISNASFQAYGAIAALLLAVNDETRTERVARQLLAQADPEAISILLMLYPYGEAQYRLLDEFQATKELWDKDNEFERALTECTNGQAFRRTGFRWEADDQDNYVGWIRSSKAGTIQTALYALERLYPFAKSESGPLCKEFLYQAEGYRRVALAKYIQKYRRHTFDFLIMDEGHEYAKSGSAQSRAAHRLTGLKLPTLLMTGTIMNGYAASLFTNMWALSPDFRSEFGRDDGPRFVDRYGYRKIYVEDREDGEVVEFGTTSDRVVRSERLAGDAPGVLPLFVIRHLLRLSVTLHKADLAIDLPECSQRMHLIDPGEDLLGRYQNLELALLNQIKADQFTERSGKLFGQLAELPSYLDRATIGNELVRNIQFLVRYPQSLGGGVVASENTLPLDTILPKEQWMLDTLRRELAEGRNVLVFVWHTRLLNRLQWLIENHLDEPAVVLDASKVNTKKRQAWIDKEVIRKERRVLIANPVAIQTGLNNLVHFSTEIWMENPACNPTVYRQATGRIDRVNQRLKTRIHFPVYAGTLQVQLYDLLMRKVAVAVSTDGLDPETALRAAGVGSEDYLAGLSIGKQLWALLQQKETSTVPFSADRSLTDLLWPENREALEGLADLD